MRILVCGGRDYFDRATVFLDLDTMHADKDTPVTMVITGGAQGADRLGEAWAIERGIPSVVCKANWWAHGKKAGWLRNNTMADLNPDFVLAFPGGRGTAMMIEIAKARGIEVIKCT
jgi:YspA, cpYpsA-related SLOG family